MRRTPHIMAEVWSHICKVDMQRTWVFSQRTDTVSCPGHAVHAHTSKCTDLALKGC